MTALEDRLREALSETAELVQWPAHAPSPRASRLRIWAAPLATATAIVLVMLGGLIAATNMPHDETIGAANGLPRHFVTLQGDDKVEVRDIDNGKVTAKVPVPPGIVVEVIMATDDDQVFYLSGSALDRNPMTAEARVLYRLRIDGAGKISGFARATWLPGGTRPDTAAITPDGTSLAINTGGPLSLPVPPVRPDSGPQPEAPMPGPPRPKLQISVITPASGRTEVFESSTRGSVQSLSWSDDGRWLLYTVVGSQGQDGLWLLDTHAGHDLLKASRRIHSTAIDRDYQAAGALGQLRDPILNADGSKFYVIAVQPHRDGGRTWTRIIEVDAATGRQLRVLFQLRYDGDPGNVNFMFTEIALEPGGRALLATSKGHGYRIDIETKQTHRFSFTQTAAVNSLAW